MNKILKLIIISLSALCTQAQYVEINCTDCSGIYTSNGVKLCCSFYSIEVSENHYEREVVILKPENVSADSVTEMDLNHPSVPFFVNETLVGFPNLRKLLIYGQLLMQPYSFSGARNLESLTLITSEDWLMVPANAFTGATKLTSILFFACTSILKFDEDAFVGLDNLDNLAFQSTPLTTPPMNLFKPLINLRDVFLYDAAIEIVHSGWFAYNVKLESIVILSPLKAVERSFIDGLPNLSSVSVYGFDGSCINETAEFQASDSYRSMTKFQSAMQTCYMNYEGMTA